jgi:hypothetical protein
MCGGAGWRRRWFLRSRLRRQRRLLRLPGLRRVGLGGMVHHILVYHTSSNPHNTTRREKSAFLQLVCGGCLATRRWTADHMYRRGILLARVGLRHGLAAVLRVHCAHEGRDKLARAHGTTEPSSNKWGHGASACTPHTCPPSVAHVRAHHSSEDVPRATTTCPPHPTNTFAKPSPQNQPSASPPKIRSRPRRICQNELALARVFLINSRESKFIIRRATLRGGWWKSCIGKDTLSG